MQFEDILTSVGGFGLYQKILCFTVIPFTTGLCGLVYTTQLIILSTPPYQCSSSQNISDNTTTLGEEAADCGECTFTYSSLFPTLTSESGWICSESWRPYTVITAFWLGNMIGAWLLGVISDKYGRRPVILISCLTYGIFGVASAFVTNYYGFVIMRIIVGSVHHTLAHVPFVLAMEFCDAKHRNIPLVATMSSYTMSSVLATGLAYSIWSWKTLLISTAAPALLIVFVYRFIPESASWQVSQCNTCDATRTLHTIARVNKNDLTYREVSDLVARVVSKDNDNCLDGNAGNVLCENEKTIECVEEGTAVEVNRNVLITSVLNYPNLLKQIVIVMVVWMIAYMCFYGHAQNTSNLGDNILMNYLLGALVEVPAWSAPWLIEKYGRKPPLMIAFTMSGLAGTLYAAFIGFNESCLFIIALCGRMSITAGYYVALQFGPEIFPTVVRGQGVALAETLGGVAILLSPAVVYSGELHQGLPLLIFGVLGLIAAAVTSSLPETKGVPLPSTLQEAEEKGKEIYEAKNQNKFICC